MSSRDDFADAIRAEFGHAPEGSRLSPGKFVRFSPVGKRGDDSGWALFFADERGGVFGCWRTGVEHTWQAEHSTTLSALDRELRAREIARCRAERAAADLDRHTEAAATASAIWAAAVPFIRHDYSDRKHIPTTGLRMHRGDGRSSPFYVTNDEGGKDRLRGDLILVPMCDADRALWSLQAIDTGGRKSFMRGGRSRGLYYLIARHLLHGVDLQTYAGEVGIVEGLATGAAVHALSGMPTFVAFSSGNLARVALMVRSKLPRARIIVAGDVDRSGTGQRAAEEAAASIRGDISLPPFTQSEIDAGFTDWCDWTIAHSNDSHRRVG